MAKSRVQRAHDLHHAAVSALTGIQSDLEQSIALAEEAEKEHRSEAEAQIAQANAAANRAAHSKQVRDNLAELLAQ